MTTTKPNPDVKPLLAAAIDIGSNAMRLRVATVGSDGHIKVIFAHREAVRLGQDAFSSGILSEATIARTEQAFANFRHYLDQYPVEQLRATGTSALRDAQNSAALIQRIHDSSGIDIDIISGDEEGRLIHGAIYQRVPQIRKKTVLLIDIGGGSVEISLCVHGTIVALESFRMGTVRLLNLFHAAANPAAFQHLLHEYIATMRDKVKKEIKGFKIDFCIGTGGNVECLAELAETLIDCHHGNRIDSTAIDQICDRLEAMSIKDRIERLRLRPDRADVIIPAALVLKSVMELVDDAPLLVPGVGLAEGILVDLLAPQLTDVTTMKRQAIGWAKSMANKFHADSKHAKRVRNAASSLFTQLGALHQLDKRDKLLLQVAAICHEIGIAVRANDHHRHAAYLIASSPMIGLTEKEKMLLAMVVRCQRKSFPTINSSRLESFTHDERERILKLALLLRLAIAINKERNGDVRLAICEAHAEGITITLNGRGDMELEAWMVGKLSKLFKLVLKTPLHAVHTALC
ncbi:MAG: Ppx/GppA phosphatase family protein [Mariprofundales bacterium]|nr:Ppx/GppA phosphatase family protein [Mariprofundales bacterium]